VIPRFIFYLQNCIEKEVEWSKELNERETVANLRDEMKADLKTTTASIKDEERNRIKDANALRVKDKELRSNIVEINDQREKEKKDCQT